MIQLGELVMILDLHRQGLSVSAIARRNAAILPDLAAHAALGHRHRDPLLVNIKTDISDRSRTARLPCMRLGTGQSGATLATCIL